MSGEHQFMPIGEGQSVCVYCGESYPTLGIGGCVSPICIGRPLTVERSTMSDTPKTWLRDRQPQPLDAEALRQLAEHLRFANERNDSDVRIDLEDAQDLLALGRRVAELEAELAEKAKALSFAIELGSHQAAEWDRFWRAIGADSEKITVDDAIAQWRERDAAQRDAATLRGALEGLVAAHDAMNAADPMDYHNESLKAASDLYDKALEAARRALAPAPAQATSEPKVLDLMDALKSGIDARKAQATSEEGR